MVAYYQHDIASWMDGTEGLSDGEYRAYHVVCELIYLNNGPIVLHESGIAGRCNQHTLAFRANLRKLIEKEKLLVAADGKLTNRRVESELMKIGRGRRPGPNPSRTSAQPPPGSAGVREGSGGGNASKPLKNKDPTLFPVALDKTRRDSEGAEAPSAEGPPDARTDLFRKGLAVLKRITGKTDDQARRLIGHWLRDANDNAVIALRVIEDAERNNVADAIPWIVAAIKSRTGGSNGTTRQSGDIRDIGYGAIAARVSRGSTPPDRR